MKKVKWGVLGVAKIAENHVIPAILEAANAELYAIASRDGEKAAAAAERFGCKAVVGYDRLLDDPEVDAVYIPLPNHLHMEWTINAARKGKHVLCEKPIALNAAECERMTAECAKHNVLLMEAFMYRYSEKTKKTLELVSTLGELTHINSTFRIDLSDTGNVRYYPEGGGSLYDVGCYPVNFISMLAGAEPVEASAVRTDKNGVDISFSAVLKYASGMTASLNAGFNSVENQINEIHGTDGVLIVNRPFIDNADELVLLTSRGERKIPVEACHRYTREITNFSQAVLTGEPLLMPLDQTLQNMRLIDRLYASAHI